MADDSTAVDINEVSAPDPDVKQIEVGPEGDKQVVKVKQKFDASYVFCYFCGMPVGPAKNLEDLAQQAKDRGMKRFRLPEGFPGPGYDRERWVCQRDRDRCRGLAKYKSSLVKEQSDGEEASGE